MEPWHILVLLMIGAIVGTLVVGWRDGWLRGTAGPSTMSDGQVAAAERDGDGPDRPDFVGIVEIARFTSLRRRIGYHTANRIIHTLAERVGGDERFEVGRLSRTSIEFLCRADTIDEAHAMMKRLKHRLEEIAPVDAIAFEPEVIIGFSPVDNEGLHDELFDMAAFALEDARTLPGRIGYADHDTLPAAADEAATMLHDLRDAVRADALDLHYMPKLKLSDSTVSTAEALCRWTHPDHGTVSPMTFIRLAEEAGLIGELTLWTLDRAIADQKRLLERGITLDIDVNISGQLVSSAEFCALVIERIGDADGRLGLEITETAVIDDPKAALANLTRIAEAGIRISIDDFGAGLSSLAYLRDLPAHELKIDQGFIRALTTSNRDPLLVRSAIDIAHALEMEVTAEGVEDEIALALLKVMRCDNVQGYLISKPLPLDQLTLYLRDRALIGMTGDSSHLRHMLRAAGSAL